MEAIQITDAKKYFYTRKKPGERHEQNVLMRLLRPAKEIVPAVDNITLNVKKGEIFGILGPNGSGKSTLIRMLSTLIIPDSGSLKIFGMDISKESLKVRRFINRVSVDAAFFKKLSAWENLSYAARLYGVDTKTARSRAKEILASLLLDEEKLDEPLENLSRGMQQKVAIARALLTSPVLLLLDEPTTGLDPVSKRQVQQYILKMRAIHDTTVLLTSHDLDEVDRICDRLAIIKDGKFLVCDTPENLKKNYSKNGRLTSLEDIFISLTGQDLTEDGTE
ncbi:ABC transporter ATP-binding protein [candidate division KSB1 bacterium]|nr:ABC transporter ATP-binding protein [candidate division KSB1 bacterium]